MKEINIDEIKEIELQLLEKFAEICEENGLRYFLAYGTLIGAVRHKGFIPWDDDIDVVMPRPDYNKLCSLIANKEINNRFLLMTPETEDYIYTFAKFVDTRTHLEEEWMLTNILGIYVDVIPLDGLPNREKDYIKLVKRTLLYHYVLLIASRKRKSRKTFLKTIISDILYYPLKIIGYKYWRDKIVKIISSNEYEKAEKVGDLSLDTYIHKERYARYIFDNYVKLEFEGKEFNAPIGYDEYLTKIYGNYMELPPIESRVKKHDNRAYWK